MIRLLLFLIVLAGLGAGAAWIAGHPGSVTMYWLDYRIDTSFAFLLLLAFLIALAAAWLFGLAHAITQVPAHFSRSRQLNHYHKGMAELTYSVAALAASDIKGAALHTRKAEKLLGNTPLVLLLSAQVARSQGDDARTRALLEQMLTHKETEYLAARSLSEAASKQQMFPKALALAQRAEAANPQGGLALIGLHLKLGQWQEALVAIDRAARKGQLTRGEKRRYRGLVHWRQANVAMENGQNEAALHAARQAVKELPDFAPVVTLAAKVFAANGKKDKAIKLLLTAWKKAPRMELAESYRRLITGESREKQVKLLQKLTAIHPIPPAANAAWTCKVCGHAAKSWEPHCPGCGGFDTLKENGHGL